MRLKERLPVLWQAPTQVRVGTDPRWSVVLTDLSPSAVRALTGLPAGATDRRIRAALQAEGASEAEAADVVGHLRAAHLLARGPLSNHPDAATLALVEADGEVEGVLTRRAAACVAVQGLGRLGSALAHTLAVGGVGHLQLDDAAPVTRSEVGWAGVHATDVGRARGAAVAEALRATGAVAVDGFGADAADLVVLVEHGVADPAGHRVLVTDGTPHLSVVLREASVLVGPLVQPGRTPCLRCLDLHRTDADPDWPAIAAQLAVRHPDAEETAVATVGAALGAAHTLAFLDGRPSALAGAALEVRLPDVVPRLVRWGAHPDCGCTGLP